MRKFSVLFVVVALAVALAPTVALALPRTVTVTNTAALIGAIRDLQTSDTISIAAGTYDVERQLGDLEFGGQPGWYLPIWKDGVTIRGAGSAVTTLTSSVESANGAWATQDFISVWANGVTIEGVTLVSKRDTNKAVEVMGKDFTLRDVQVLTNPLGPSIGDPFAKFGGSVYFNPIAEVAGVEGDAGASRLEGVLLDGGWISARSDTVTSGAVSLEGVTLDWVGAYYASNPLFGPFSANPLIVSEDGVVFISDDTMADYSAQVTSRMPTGTVLVFENASTAVPAGLFSGPHGADGEVSISSEATSAGGTPLYTWSFPYATLSASYDATFYPGVTLRTTPSTPLHYGAAGLNLVFEHDGDLPGPAELRICVGKQFAGKTFTEAFFGEALFQDVVDANGYLTVPVSSTDKLYLIERPKVVVTFDTAGGTAIAKQNLLYNSKVATPAVTPTKPGYSFMAWYADKAFTTTWKFPSNVVLTDTTIYARYSSLPRATISNPIAPATMSRTTSSTVYGTLKPRHAPGSSPVRIFKYRYENGTWKAYGWVWAKASDQSTYTKYSCKLRLPYTGRWRLRAYAIPDSKHSATWSSGYDYVTVR